MTIRPTRDASVASNVALPGKPLLLATVFASVGTDNGLEEGLLFGGSPWREWSRTMSAGFLWAMRAAMR
jgi:hypothetical protein